MNPLAHVLTSVGYPHRQRTVPPAEPPDLLQESEHATARAVTARIAAGLEQGRDADLKPVVQGLLDRVEPPSLDPVVFGPPRVFKPGGGTC